MPSVAEVLRHYGPEFLQRFSDRMPAEHHKVLRAVVRRHQRICYAAMFQTSSEAIKLLARDPKYVGTDRPRFFGVPHSWGRTLDHHPHIHYIVPGEGLSDDSQSWLPSRADFYVPVKALSMIYRAKFRDALVKAGLIGEVDPEVWQLEWVVRSQAVGDGWASLKYLAPYVFRMAISDRRIVSSEDGHVTFLYRKSGSRHWRKSLSRLAAEARTTARTTMSKRLQPTCETSPKRSSFTLRAWWANTGLIAVIVYARPRNCRPIDRHVPSLQALATESRVSNCFGRF